MDKTKMSTELAVINHGAVAKREAVEPQALTINEMMTMADMFSKSGMFSDVRDVAKAFVKIQAGRELGVPPFAAMRGVSIIQGNAALGATLVAGRMKAHGYDWEEIARTDEKCELRIIKPNGKTAGTSCFSMEDAKKAGLAGKDNWNKYRRSMLFARCITDAARTWAPEVFFGIPVYTPDELESAAGPSERVVTPVSQPISSDPQSIEELLSMVTSKRTAEHHLGWMLWKFKQYQPEHGRDQFSAILDEKTGHSTIAALINSITKDNSGEAVVLIKAALTKMWKMYELAAEMGIDADDAEVITSQEELT